MARSSINRLMHKCPPSPPSRWLQPDSYADPQKTSLILNKDDIRCSWPTTVAVQTKDQYGDIVHVPNMKVRVFFPFPPPIITS